MYRDRNLVRRVGKRIVPGRDTIRNLFQDLFNPSSEFEKQPNKSDNTKTAQPRNQVNQNNKKNEAYYRDKLARKLKGRTEIKTPHGDRVDILTSTEIIEVKRVENWKSALGQIEVYWRDFPRYQKRIHLFGDKSSVNHLIVEQRCNENNVIVTWEDDEEE